ncbi:MAG: SCO7613 C-terminal domain-containing membrane protein [Sporichthyaceae bacterium]
MTRIEIDALRDAGRCPDCTAELPAEPVSCPNCALPLRGPLVDRLWRLSQQAAHALEQRQSVLEALRGGTESVPGVPSPETWQPRREPEPAHRESVTPRQIQHLLLGLGVLLLAVAALIFVVVAWSRIDIGGRTAILAGVTVSAAAGAVVAHRRELVATAEALAVLTVGLLLLDAFGAHAYGFAGADDIPADSWWAGVFAALAALAYAARRAIPLETARWVAALAVQLPVPILYDRLGVVGASSALVLQGTAALAMVGRRGPLPAWLGSGALAWLAGGLGLVVLAYGFADERSVDRGAATALLALAAVCAGTLAWDRRAIGWLGVPAAAAATAAMLAAGHSWLERSLDHDVATAAAVALLVVASALLAAVQDEALDETWRRLRLGPLAVLAAAAALATLDVAEPIGEALAGALHHLGGPWEFTLDADALERLGQPWEFHRAVGFTVVLLTAAAALLAYRLRGTPAGSAAVGAAAFGAVASALIVPIALRAPYLAAVLGLVLLGAAMLHGASRLLPTEEKPWDAAGRRLCAALFLAGSAAIAIGVAWSLASRGATAWALATLAAAAVGLRMAGGPAARPRATGLAAVAVVAEAGVLARIAGAGIPAAGTTAIAAAGLLAIAARALPSRFERIALEASCVLGAVCAVPTLGEDSRWAAVALLIAGVAAAVVAMDPARREVGWLSGVLLTGSSWVRLAAADVSTPEAYTLPPAVALLIVGSVMHVKNRELSSWRTFGPGLALAFVPSLLATLDDEDFTRALLLGVAALCVLLVGVSAKLQAPLALGGAMLAVDAVVQIAPYADAVPRWVSIGAAGILLLGLGATFERRLRDVRQLAVRFADLG